MSPINSSCSEMVKQWCLKRYLFSVIFCYFQLSCLFLVNFYAMCTNILFLGILGTSTEILLKIDKNSGAKPFRHYSCGGPNLYELISVITMTSKH